MSEDERAWEEKESIPHVSQRAQLIAAGVDAWTFLAVSSLNFLWLGRNVVALEGPRTAIQEAFKGAAKGFSFFLHDRRKTPLVRF